jgi:hypothetical protein
MARLMSVALTEQAVRDRRKIRLTVERLRAVLEYNADTGEFRWTGAPTVTGRQRNNAGRVAGTLCRQSGYIKVGVDGRRYQAHCLAWFYVHGQWPIAELDHRNGVRSDNRLANLRAATRPQNAQNLQRAHRDNGTGLLGVRQHSPTRFSATIMVAGKRRHLGSFRTAEGAHEAYMAAKAQLHPYGRR